MNQKWKPGTLALTALVMEFSLLLSVFFDIPVARQVIGFLFLTLIPGYTILRFLKLKLERLETVIFSVGLSLAFLMISTFLMNLILPLLGVAKPLTLFPLLLLTSSMLIILVVSEWRSSLNLAFSTGSLRLAISGILLAIPLFLTIIGVFLVRTPPHSNNSVLLIMLLTISILVGLALFAKRLFPAEVYPLLLLVITICLLLHISLFSSYLQGGDIFGEYFDFNITAVNGFWDPSLASRLSAMLSVTVLPTTYYYILGLSSTWVFKIVFPLLFAFVPLGLYQLYKSKMSVEVALFSVFFFVSNLVFFTEIAELARQMIGELFYVLLFLTLFSNNVKGSSKWVLFFAFSVGLVVSHYAMALIFLAFLAVTWLIGIIRKTNTKTTASLVILLGILVFAWYIYISQASTFNDLLGTVNYVRAGFTSDFFNPESRGGQVAQAVSVSSGISTVWHLVGRYLYYITAGLIIAGFIISILRERFSFLDNDRNVLIFLNLALLSACFIIPNFSTTFNASRFYHVTLFFLAPLCVLGGLGILNFIVRKRVKEKILISILVLCVLIPFFLIQTGFVYEITKEESYSLPLSSYRIDAMTITNMGVLTETEVSGGMWLSKYANRNATVYADVTAGSIFVCTVLPIPCLLYWGDPLPSGDYVYLRNYNIASGKLFSTFGQSVSYNLTQTSPSLDDSDLIYSSGSCEVYNIP
jgi:uncharacterized membrane protein